jgi:hypothetical protein
VTHWYSLESRLSFCIVPRNIQHIRFGCPRYDFEPVKLIMIRVNWAAVDPSGMRQNSLLSRLHGSYGVEPNMSMGRTAVWRFFIFQKDGQDLDRFE